MGIINKTWKCERKPTASAEKDRAPVYYSTTCFIKRLSYRVTKNNIKLLLAFETTQGCSEIWLSKEEPQIKILPS